VPIGCDRQRPKATVTPLQVVAEQLEIFTHSLPGVGGAILEFAQLYLAKVGYGNIHEPTFILAPVSRCRSRREARLSLQVATTLSAANLYSELAIPSGGE